MTGQRLFWIDDRYADLPRDDIAPAPSAAPPGGWPPRRSPIPGWCGGTWRVLSAGCVRNTWDRSLTARVRPAPPPAALAASREWWRDRGWQGRPEIFGQFVEPAEQDLAKAPHLRATVQVDAPVPLDPCPPPRTRGRPRPSTVRWR